MWRTAQIGGAPRRGVLLLNWSQEELAKRARVAKQTLADFERGARSPYPRTLADIRAALEAEGVEFTNGDAPGVRLRKRK